MEDSFFYKLLIYSSLDDNHTYCIRCYTCAQRGNYMNYDVNYIKEVLYHAGEYIMGQLRDDSIYSKGKDDYVTEIDLIVQDQIKTCLMDKYPDVQFMSEEQINEVDFSQPCWVLDPIDGTTNLIHDYHCSVISLALLENGEPTIGLIYNPYMRELFYGVKGQGAYLNEHPIHVSHQENLSSSLVAVGTSPYYKNDEMLDKNFHTIKEVMKRCSDIRRSGSCVLDIAWTACGRVEAYLERRVKLWDYAAGKVILEEAGGILCDYRGHPIKNQLITNLVVGKENVVHDLISQCINK